MNSAETIAVVRDLFLIAAAAVFIVLFVPAAIYYFRFVRTMQRAAQNLETISSTLLNGVVRPLTSLSGLMDLIDRIVGLVQRRKSPERSDGDGQG